MHPRKASPPLPSRPFSHRRPGTDGVPEKRRPRGAALAERAVHGRCGRSPRVCPAGCWPDRESEELGRRGAAVRSPCPLCGVSRACGREGSLPVARETILYTECSLPTCAPDPWMIGSMSYGAR
ncbi:hypothetical protein HPB47_012238 [Ixodes persulcatus]|uniref:Uncharacterized protein n=1 Tax=Ixodes persulcatus TaxID=34615 RepID=A0AC60NU27_IXOPE|nr:hypothetical protein HPB47_012238 [Ixodes persulcatus]